MSVRIPSQTDVIFKAAVINCFKVSHCSPESTSYAAGLRVGDLVIGVDGNEFENQQQMQLALMGGKPEKKLMIQRGSRIVDVTLKVLEAMRSGDTRMQPTTR